MEYLRYASNWQADFYQLDQEKLDIAKLSRFKSSPIPYLTLPMTYGDGYLGYLSEEIYKREPEEQELIFEEAHLNSEEAVNVRKYHQKHAFRDVLFTFI